MTTNEPVTLARDVEASVVPVGTKITLLKGEQARITQSLGGSYTVIVRGNMFRVEGKDADALGMEVTTPANVVGQASRLSSGRLAREGVNAGETPAAAGGTPAPLTPEQLENEIWQALRTCYDPEIPVNVVDLGLIYDCKVSPATTGGGNQADIKMTLTAPGCGMGPVLAQDVQNKLLSIEGIDEANVELVWDPPWNQGMMTEEAKLQLGLY